MWTKTTQKPDGQVLSHLKLKEIDSFFPPPFPNDKDRDQRKGIFVSSHLLGMSGSMEFAIQKAK